MGHSDDSLRPESEHGIDQDDRHDEGQPDQASAHHVDDERFCEHFAGVGRAKGVNSGKGGGDVEPRVQEVRNPFCVGNAVVVDDDVVVVSCVDVQILSGAIWRWRRWKEKNVNWKNETQTFRF